jgi:hypothetical protein
MKIIAHMVVGPGEASRYLDVVLERAKYWADELIIAIDSAESVEALAKEEQIVSEHADAYYFLANKWATHEGRCRQEAWNSMVSVSQPTEDDYIFLIDADEVVVEHQHIRGAVVQHHGKRLGFTFRHMWTPKEYRVDRLWAPTTAWVLIPFRKGGTFRDRPIACGREPTYADNIPRLDRSVGTILHYGYMLDADKESKFRRYMTLDGGQYHNREHLRSILWPPSLEQWEGGGLIHVEEISETQ